MITDKLYTNAITRQGFTLTNAVTSFTSSGEFGKNIFCPYTMGYIPYEIYPKFYNLGVITPVYSSSENKLIFQTLTSPDNHAWGYCAHTSNSYTGNSTDFYVRYSNSRWKASQFNDEVAGIRLINSGYLASYTLNNYFSCTVVISETRDGGVATRGTYTNNTGISTVSDFNQFCKGEKDIVVAYNGNSYNISISDFNERGYATKRKVSDDATLIIGICQFKSICSGSGNSSSSPYLQIYPWIEVKQDVNSEIYSLYQCGACLQTMSITGGYVVINIGNGTSEMTGNNQQILPPLDADARFFYGIEGELTYEEASAWANDDSEDYQYVESLNCFRRHSSGGQYYSLIPCIHPKEIKTVLDLRLKSLITATGQSDYPTASTQYSNSVEVNVYNSSDTPTGNVLNGDYSTIENRLRPWQLWQSNITTNTFNPSDIPPYVPPTPPPTPGGDSSGDNITPYNFVNTPLGAANNFITLYSLNTAQVADFGRRMWASLSDTAFWESVGTVFLNDFSINPADMMKYFVSLRYFPFDLSIVHSSQTWGIYIGRSSYPIQPSIGTELPHRITMNLVQLDGGSVFVPNNYNDFRDYEPYTKVSVIVPFCGVLELTPSEVVGKNLYLDYVIDLQTGTIKATVYVQSDTFFIVGSISGVCGSQIPITANNNIEFLQRIANVGSSINSGSSAGNAADTVAGLTGSGAIGAVAGGVVMGANAVGSMLSLPPITVHKQGNATGFANYGGSSQAYLTVQRQKYIIPDNYGHSVGYATAFSSVLSALSGFTVCSNVDLSGFTCHEDERSEIKALLESGVYL